jgi:hypothetical protein
MFGSGQVSVLYMLLGIMFGFLQTVGDFILVGGNLGDLIVTLFL